MQVLKNVGIIFVAIGLGVVVGGVLSYGHQLKEPTPTPAVTTSSATPATSSTPTTSASSLLNQPSNAN